MITEVDVFNRALSRLGDLRFELATAKTGATATAASPVVVTITAHGYATGDLVLLERFVQMTAVNGRVFRITVLTANTFELDNEDGTTYTAESSGGRARKLPSVKAVLACFDAWKGVTGRGARDEVLRDHPWNCAGRRARLARLAAPKAITGATAANPVVLTIASHGYTTGDLVLLENVGGMVELNDRYLTVLALTANTVALQSLDGSTFTAYTSGGTAKKALTPLTPDFGYRARYDLPSDCVRVLDLVDSISTFEVLERELLTDDGPTVPIRYTRRLKDPTRWDDLLVSAFEARLAVECFEEVATASSTKREQLERAYLELLARAKRSDAQESSPSAPADDDWTLAREL